MSGPIRGHGGHLGFKASPNRNTFSVLLEEHFWIACCLSSLTLCVRILFMARCTRYNIMWTLCLSWSVTCGRSVIFSGYSGFLRQQSRPPRQEENIAQSGVKHHNPNLTAKYSFNISTNIESKGTSTSMLYSFSIWM